ncbi:MAG: ABC transporter permease [Verrucomicrobia bacterium]|nr:ABC transporter permease [Verrucomicrobiota bacterium]
MRSFSLFLALRYLKPRRTFLSIITLISVLGVTLGITVLILVISVMTGFDRELKRKVVGFDAHLLITNRDLLPDWRTTAEAVKKASPEIVALSPFVLGPVILEYQSSRMAPKIRGVDAKLEGEVSEIRNSIVEGKWDLDGQNAVLGAEIARALGAKVGDKVTIYSPGNLKAVFDELEQLDKTGDRAAKDQKVAKLRELILPTEVTVTGIFKSGRYIYDAEFLFIPLYLGQELYGLKDHVHGIQVKTQDAYRAEAVKQQVMRVLEPPMTALTWMDLNHSFFEAVRLERTVMFFLLFFIIIVAAFGIMNTLITVTVQKTREIGILKALGARVGQIVWVFLAQGMVVGVLGNITGVSLGLTLTQYRNEFRAWLASTLGIEVFPASVYQFTELPAQVVPGDVALICVSAFVICSVAALVPAYFAARLDPVKALRME